MPELPEVETTRRGLYPHLVGATIRRVTVRNAALRQPVPDLLTTHLRGRKVLDLQRRAKYLLARFTHGTLISHLGMSGSWRVVSSCNPPRRHDHVELHLGGGASLRYHDPRRFGLLLWTDQDPQVHPLLRHLGPEPFAAAFDGLHLYRRSRGRRIAVKNFVMDPRVVVGVGNIYASEALFRAGIHPARAAGRVSAARYQKLATAICDTLAAAIRAGGTTLRDFTDEGGQPGYFQQQLLVYGQDGRACTRCQGKIRRSVLGQRSTFHCPGCQR